MIPFSKNSPLRRKFWTRLLLICLAVAFLLVNGAGMYMGHIIYTETSLRHSRRNAQISGRLQERLEQGKRDKQWQDITLTSRFGYLLKGTFIPHPTPTEKTLIFVHGFTENRLVGLNYLTLYQTAGYNLLLFDSRAHGESGGESVTWGVYEKQDLDQWVDWVRQRFPAGVIGVHGISMGAATALLHAQLNESSKRVAFYIADSAYSDVETILAAQISRRIQLPAYIRPEYLLPYANMVAYFHSRFTYAQAAPIKAVSLVTTPVLYIHGEADKVVPASMSHALYHETKGVKQISTFPDASHVSSIYKDRYRYGTVVRNFAQRIPPECSKAGNCLTTLNPGVQAKQFAAAGNR